MNPVIPADTSPEAWSRHVEFFRRLDGPRRLALMLEMCDEARDLAASGVRRRRPELDEDAVRREVVRLFNDVAPRLG